MLDSTFVFWNKVFFSRGRKIWFNDQSQSCQIFAIILGSILGFKVKLIPTRLNLQEKGDFLLSQPKKLVILTDNREGTGSDSDCDKICLQCSAKEFHPNVPKLPGVMLAEYLHNRGYSQVVGFGSWKDLTSNQLLDSMCCKLLLAKKIFELV